MGLRAFSDNIADIFHLAADNTMNDDDESEFARLLSGVKRLHNDKINVYKQRDSKKAGQQVTRREQEREQAFPSESLPAQDSQFNAGLQKKLQRKIRQGVIRPESSIDLHGYRQQEALEALSAFIDESLQQRHRMVLVIHGQGYRSQKEAVLKPLIQRWLTTQPQVLAWCPAQVHDGAAGASYVYLRAD